MSAVSERCPPFWDNISEGHLTQSEKYFWVFQKCRYLDHLEEHGWGSKKERENQKDSSKRKHSVFGKPFLFAFLGGGSEINVLLSDRKCGKCFLERRGWHWALFVFLFVLFLSLSLFFFFSFSPPLSSFWICNIFI